MKLIPQDARGFEKFVYIIGFGLPILLLPFMVLSAWGVFHNYYSVACQDAGWGWKIPGTLFFLGVVYELYIGFKEPENAVSNFVLLVGAVLSLGFYCGFGTPYYL
jgi:hypothetical protein